MTIVIEKITAREIFKNVNKKIMITTVTNVSIGYDIVFGNSEDISEIENVISPELSGYSPLDLEYLDGILSELNVKPSICTGVSISIARAAANSLDIPFFKFLGGAITIDLPSVSSAILKDNKGNELFPIINVESVEEIIDFYLRVVDELSVYYNTLALDGAYRCGDIFKEISKIREIIDIIKEDEDIDVLLGLSTKKEKIDSIDLSEIDYLEVEEPVEFDGLLCTNEVYDVSDFVKINPYELRGLTELCYYIDYILDKGLSPIIVGDSSSITHLGVSYRVPFIRASLSSNVLNELLNIERTLTNPILRKF